MNARPVGNHMDLSIFSDTSSQSDPSGQLVFPVPRSPLDQEKFRMIILVAAHRALKSLYVDNDIDLARGIAFQRKGARENENGPECGWVGIVISAINTVISRDFLEGDAP